MTDFFRFPRTPHLACLGEGQPRDDKVLSPSEVSELLSGEVVVEEKVDGANVGFSVDDDGMLRVQNRGAYLSAEHAHPQFKPLFRWLSLRQHEVADALFPDLILFGEWCYAKHSILYDRLPDWFVGFDVFDSQANRFANRAARDAILESLEVPVVPCLARGRFSLDDITNLLGLSHFGDTPAEGIYLRYDDGDWLGQRAKLVRPDFVQAIREHWSRGPLQVNRLG